MARPSKFVEPRDPLRGGFLRHLPPQGAEATRVGSGGRTQRPSPSSAEAGLPERSHPLAKSRVAIDRESSGAPDLDGRPTLESSGRPNLYLSTGGLASTDGPPSSLRTKRSLPSGGNERESAATQSISSDRRSRLRRDCREGRSPSALSSGGASRRAKGIARRYVTQNALGSSAALLENRGAQGALRRAIGSEVERAQRPRTFERTRLEGLA